MIQAFKLCTINICNKFEKKLISKNFKFWQLFQFLQQFQIFIKNSKLDPKFKLRPKDEIMTKDSNFHQIFYQKL